jgi:predicted DNA-binding transcriptional regulator YafY
VKIGMTANERRRAILEVLCVRRYDKRENLAFEFNVSKNTIDRDIIALSCEYPIYTVQGNGGGIYVEKSYKLDKQYLTDEETELLKKILPHCKGETAEIMKSILRKFSLHNQE